MDIELARTFLAISETGNFYKAAERLNVTQSTISMRVKSLEASFGRPLFSRGKGGANMTAAGHQFHRHAATLVRVWRQAHQEVGLSPGYSSILAVGGQFTLWDRLILKWLDWIRDTAPSMAIRAEVALSDDLMRRLTEGTLDVGVMYTPQSRSGLNVEELLVERLIMVSTDPATSGPHDNGYVFVDWGPEFLTNHNNAYPDLETPRLQVSHGPLALQYILDNGGAGYFPARIVRPHLSAKSLFLVNHTPTFSRPVYLVSPADRTDPDLTAALTGLRYVAALESES